MKVDGNTIRDVCLCGYRTHEGERIYPASVFGDGSIYNNKPVFLNHSGEDRDPLDRNLHDYAGIIQNARMENGKPFGDIQTADTVAGKHLLAVAKDAPNNVGMSHSGYERTNEDGVTVNSIEEVTSVDIVFYPASSKCLCGSITSNCTCKTKEQDMTANDKAILKEMVSEIKEMVASEVKKQLAGVTGNPQPTINNAMPQLQGILAFNNRMDFDPNDCLQSERLEFAHPFEPSKLVNNIPPGRGSGTYSGGDVDAEDIMESPVMNFANPLE